MKFEVTGPQPVIDACKALSLLADGHVSPVSPVRLSPAPRLRFCGSLFPRQSLRGCLHFRRYLPFLTVSHPHLLRPPGIILASHTFFAHKNRSRCSKITRSGERARGSRTRQRTSRSSTRWKVRRS
mgnify:CR=1 FL=1